MKNYLSNPIEISGNCYFVSDFHLGAPSSAESFLREKRIVNWMNSIQDNVDYLFFLGDVFDFWFEYKYVIPKGYYLFFSKIKEFREKGITIYFFSGNHDMWVKRYLTDEFQMQIFRQQQIFIINGKRCLVGHGDGLGKGDLSYKFIKWLFSAKFNVFLYGLLPSSWAFSLARFSSRKSRSLNSLEKKKSSIEKERNRLISYIDEVSQSLNIDYFFYGHWHQPVEMNVSDAMYYNTGDWLVHDSFVSYLKENDPQLKSYVNN